MAERITAIIILSIVILLPLPALTNASTVKSYPQLRDQYKPGDTLVIEGFLDQLSPGEPLAIEVRDPNNHLIYSDQTTLNETQGYRFQFRLPETAMPGSYTVYLVGPNFNLVLTFKVKSHINHTDVEEGSKLPIIGTASIVERNKLSLSTVQIIRISGVTALIVIVGFLLIKRVISQSEEK